MEEVLLEFVMQYYEDVSHPLWVAERFPSGSDGWILGLCHDLFEDTEITEEELHSFLKPFGKEYLVWDAQTLTRRKNETYRTYIERVVASNRLVRRVKRQDLQHHLSRTETLKESLKKRYLWAMSMLS